MISLLLNASKKIISSIIKPDLWTVDNAQATLNTSTYPRVAFESTILKHQIRNLGVSEVRVSCAYQYQINFRFDGKLKYNQLPVRELTDILSYLAFVFSSHPGLLEKTVSELEAYDIWQYQKVDPCLYDNTTARYSIENLNLNSFIPIIEQSNNDWLMVLVLSFEVDFQADKSEYRKYFEEVLNEQVDANPALSGGKIGNIDKLTLNLFKTPQNKKVATRIIE